ncbi:MAG: NUDIX domain-containing protein [Anaerolineae bacterium]|nr:NUDIX domain-containing protein [Anaerolineae bacterium]
MTNTDVQPLVATINAFHGVVVDPDRLDTDPEVFALQLAQSLAGWRADDYNVVWLEIPIHRAVLIPAAVQAGFIFHHSLPDSVTMTARLAPDAVIPPFATHYIGGGGLVLNKRQELLVVTERVHRHRHPHYYKLPGGALRPGEHLVDAVMREVREETGIHTRFQALMGFRHWHGYRFGKSDIYFICRLEPLSEEIQIQESEIEECMWMDLDRYLADEHVGVFNKQMVAAAARGEGLVPGWFEGYDADPENRELFVPGMGEESGD